MTVLRIDHYNIAAPADLIESVREFYTNVVGLTEGDRPPFRSRGYWLYAEGEAILHLTIAPGGSGEQNSDARGFFDHVALSCRGLASTMRRLAECSVPFEMSEVPGTTRVQLFVRDPAGVGVELSFFNERLEAF